MQISDMQAAKSVTKSRPEAIFSAYARVNPPKRFHAPLQAFAVEIHPNQSKLFRVSKLPFKIVEHNLNVHT
jgi:hypothetical protein